MTAPASGGQGQVLLGIAGQAHALPLDPAHWRVPEQSATVSAFLLTLPGAHPLWSQFLLSGVHLRDVEGQSKPAYRRHPNSTHELQLIALDPGRGPYTIENFFEKSAVRSCFLVPLNVVEQLEEATDDQMRELVHLVAHGLVDGHLIAEPSGITGAREHWRTTLDRTLEHIQLGRHPEDRP